MGALLSTNRLLKRHRTRRQREVFSKQEYKEDRKSHKKTSLSCIYTGDFFASDFLIKMDLAKLHLLDGGSHRDKSNLTTGNECLKLIPVR